MCSTSGLCDTSLCYDSRRLRNLKVETDTKLYLLDVGESRLLQSMLYTGQGLSELLRTAKSSLSTNLPFIITCALWESKTAFH